MPLGPAVSLPLSGCVGVHHTGRVHPGANSQWLLLHTSRGPSRQVVLDPEHLRGPKGPAGAAAPPGGQNNRRRNNQQKSPGGEGRVLLDEGRVENLVRLQRHWNVKAAARTKDNGKGEIKGEEEERGRGRGEQEKSGGKEKQEEVCRRKWPLSFGQLHNF